MSSCNGFSHSTEDDIVTMSKHVWNKNYIRILEVLSLVLLSSYGNTSSEANINI